MPEILDIATEKMNKTISVMKQEYNSLRAGRANPQALDRKIYFACFFWFMEFPRF